MKERVERLQSRSSFHWNTPPGALAVLPEFSQHDRDFPFYWRHHGHLVNGFNTTGHMVTGSNDTSGLPAARFTAVVYVTTPGPVTSSSPVYRLVRTLGRSRHLHKVSHVTIVIHRFIDSLYFCRQTFYCWTLNCCLSSRWCMCMERFTVNLYFNHFVESILLQLSNANSRLFYLITLLTDIVRRGGALVVSRHLRRLNLDLLDG